MCLQGFVDLFALYDALDVDDLLLAASEEVRIIFTDS